jgi:hypothetical protein
VAVTPAGKVVLHYPSGDRRNFDPSRLPGNAGADLVRLYQPTQATFHIGDQLRFAAGDPRRGITPADTATLTAASRDGLTLTTSAGRSISLGATDPLLRRLSLGYALNAHQAQGTTATHAIIAAHAREGPLLTRSLTHVLFTVSVSLSPPCGDAADIGFAIAGIVGGGWWIWARGHTTVL